MTALNEIRKTIVHMAHYSHASHVGAALSVVDILYVLYTKIARITKENVFSLDRDKVILSKGHASTALYSVLAYCGLLDKEKLERYYIDGGELEIGQVASAIKSVRPVAEVMKELVDGFERAKGNIIKS